MSFIGIGISPAAVAVRSGGGTPAPTPKLVVLVAAGQSNQEGVGARDPATDLDYAGIWQFGNNGGLAVGEQPAVITSNITPLRHNDVALRPGGTGNTDESSNVSWLSPAEYTARELIEGGYCAKVLVVPCARGSTPLVSAVSPTWRPSAVGDLTDIAIAQANAAIAAISSFPAFAGHSVEVVLSWVQGERDGDNGESVADYRAQHNLLIGRLRSEITGATNAKLLMGSLIPNWFQNGGANYTVAYERINHAQVLQALSLSNAFYWRGSAGFVAAPDGKHYAPASVVREQGRRIAKPLTAPNTLLPTITTSEAVGTTTGQTFALALTHNAEHGTFHIVGGANAALFEISDPYLNPVLRWVGNGTGPASDGAYVVQIVARNGAGVSGPVRTITATASTPVAPTEVSHVQAAGSPFQDTAGSGVRNYCTYANVPLKVGVNYIAVVTEARTITAIYANNTNGNSAQSGSVTATKVADPDTGTTFDVSLWEVVMTQEGTFPIWVQGSASGFSCSMAVGALVGAAAGVTDTAVKVSGSVANPATTGADTLAVPNNGLGIAVAKCSGATDVTWLDGLTEVGADILITTVSPNIRLSVAIVPENFNAAIRFNSGGGNGQGIAAAAWALQP